MMRAATKPKGEAGFTILEIMVAASILAIGLMAALASVSATLMRIARAREEKTAALACARVRETFGFVRFRAIQNATSGNRLTGPGADPSNWLFRGNFEIARNTNGTAFLMPDCRTSATVTDDPDGAGTLPAEDPDGAGPLAAMTGCVQFEFPIPPLVPLTGRTHAGKVIFYVSEAAQPVLDDGNDLTAQPTPPRHFPFLATRGLTKLDCDGDGALTTTDLRQQTSVQPTPCRLLPVRVVVDWRSDRGTLERYEEYFLMAHPGRD